MQWMIIHYFPPSYCLGCLQLGVSSLCNQQLGEGRQCSRHRWYNYIYILHIRRPRPTQGGARLTRFVGNLDLPSKGTCISVQSVFRDWQLGKAKNPACGIKQGHMIHVWYIYLHFGDFLGKCWQIHQHHGAFGFVILSCWSLSQCDMSIPRIDSWILNLDAVTQVWRPSKGLSIVPLQTTQSAICSVCVCLPIFSTKMGNIHFPTILRLIRLKCPLYKIKTLPCTC